MTCSAYHIVRSVNDPQTYPERELHLRDILIVGCGLDFEMLRERLEAGGETNPGQLLLASHHSGGVESNFPDNAVYEAIRHHMDDDNYYILDDDGNRMMVDGSTWAFDPWNLHAAQQFGKVIAQFALSYKWDGLYLDQCFGSYPDYLLNQLNWPEHDRDEFRRAWNHFRDVLIDTIAQEWEPAHPIHDPKAKLRVIANTGFPSFLDARLHGVTLEFNPQYGGGDPEAARPTFAAYYAQGCDLNVAWFVDDEEWGVIAKGGEIV